ncbi:Sad1-interacting factor 3 [Sorochytrium milnesiophthora]
MASNMQYKIQAPTAATASGSSNVANPRPVPNRSTSTKLANPSRKTVLFPLSEAGSSQPPASTPKPRNDTLKIDTSDGEQQQQQQQLQQQQSEVAAQLAEEDKADAYSVKSNIAELADAQGWPAQTLAEYMSKEERWGMPRVTAYVTAADYDIPGLITFLVTKHRVQVRSYDGCLYAPYPSYTNMPLFATPINNPSRSSRSRSSLQAQILRNRLIYPPRFPSPLLRSISEPILPESSRESRKSTNQATSSTSAATPPQHRESESGEDGHLLSDDPQSEHDHEQERERNGGEFGYAGDVEDHPDNSDPDDHGVADQDDLDRRLSSISSDWSYHTDDIPLSHGEVFFFDYGVTVFWNFTEAQEKKLLEAIQPFEMGRLPEDEVQVEDFHFQYERTPGGKARIFNDMITLRTGNLKTQLTISHAIAQSCKLAFFEVRMSDTIESTQHIPQSLARTGHVQLSRRDVIRFRGIIFQLKVDVNLVTNVLDTPDFFWTEPGLTPLYHAVQTYLEIPQRVATVNIRTSVLSDLLEMLSSHTTTTKMDYLTWIIIALISVDVVVMLGEIFVKGLSAAVTSSTTVPPM